MDREWLSSNQTLRAAGVIFLGFASLLLFIGTIGVIRAWNESDSSVGEKPQITVLGMGEVTAIPDIAQFSFTVNEEGKTTKEAQDKATTKINAAIAYLKNAKIQERDIKTVGYNINPKYEYQKDQTISCIGMGCPGKQVISGYEVSQTIQIKVRDTNQAGTILSGIGGLGVNNVSGLDLTIDDETALSEEARQKAIDDAREKAEVLARDLGVRIVRITSFQENSSGGSMYYAKLEAQDSRAVGNPAPQIPTGENTIVSNVTITYEIR